MVRRGLACATVYYFEFELSTGALQLLVEALLPATLGLSIGALLLIIYCWTCSWLFAQMVTRCLTCKTEYYFEFETAG